MTRRTNARIAGLTFLLYIALGIGAMLVSRGSASGPDMAARLAAMAQHASQVRVAAALNLLTGFAALVLAVTLYALTRDEDRDIALVGLVCRVAEGVVGGLSIQRSLGLLWLATVRGPNAPAPDAAQALAAWFQLGQTWSPTIGAAFFAVGSTCFAWLLLRGHIVPAALAGLGVVTSVLLGLGLLLQVAGAVPGSLVQWLWAPMAVFEVVLALWLLVKGAAPARAAA